MGMAKVRKPFTMAKLQYFDAADFEWAKAWPAETSAASTVTGGQPLMRLAGHLYEGSDFGLLAKVLVSVLGAVLGGWLFGLLGLSA
jgi:hypothetical protein